MSTETTRKRQRDVNAEADTLGSSSVSSMRSSLATRVASSQFWRHAASSADLLGTDAFLVYLGRSIATALQSTAHSAEVSRAQLSETRSSLHAAIDARCDELNKLIDSDEFGKVDTLERELISVDAALEHWRTESAAVCEAASSLPDDEFYSQHAALLSRVGAMESQLRLLPTVVVSPSLVRLLADAGPVVSSIESFGRMLSPVTVKPVDLHLERVPCGVRSGDSLCLRLTWGTRITMQPAEELEASLGRLVETTNVEASVCGPLVELESLQSTCVADAAQHCLLVSFEIPGSSPCGSSVYVNAVRIAGQPFVGFPRIIPVFRGVIAPLRLARFSASSIYSTAPCITPAGRLYCPSVGEREVMVFDADGAQLPGVPVSSIGLSRSTRWSAYAHADTPSLLLSDYTGSGDSRLVAVDPSTYAVRWKSAEPVQNCSGIAALPVHGVVIVNSVNCLSAHRLFDGRCVGQLAVPGLDSYVAADPTTGTIFASVNSSGGSVWKGVHAWSCVSDSTGMQITAVGQVLLAGGRPSMRVLAVMPPAPGKRDSHLIVGTTRSSELLVLSQPGFALVHTHALQGLRVLGLAADPWGSALAVCDDTTQAVHVLAWPLPGMSPLE